MVQAAQEARPNENLGPAERIINALTSYSDHMVHNRPGVAVADNAEELVRPAGLVIDCLDNAASRTVLQKAVRHLAVPCLHGALAADGGFGRVVWDECFTIDEESAQGAATCEGGEHLPFIAIVSGYIAQAARMFWVHGKRVGFHVHPTGAISI